LNLSFFNNLDELRSIGFIDIQESIEYIKIITDQKSLDQFQNSERDTKILLQTGDNSNRSSCLQLYEMAEPFYNLDVKIGIAVKSISSKYELRVQLGKKPPKCYNSNEISHALSIIGATVGIGTKNEIIFHSMNAMIFETKLFIKNKEELIDLNNLIENLMLMKDIIISNSRLETLNLLTKNDNEWKGYIPIDAIQTSFLAMKILRTLITTEMSKSIKWIAGNLDIPDMASTGFLFIVKNSKVIAVCLDDLDVTLLKEKFDKESEKSLDILSPKNMKYSFYPERAFFSEKIIKVIEFQNHKNLEINEYGLKSFEEEPNSDLMNALELTCSSISGNETDIIATIAKFAINENEDLKNVLSRMGFCLSKNKFDNQILSEDNKQMIAKSIHDILKLKYPLTTKINIAIQALNEIISSDKEITDIQRGKFDQLITDLITTISFPVQLKNKIEVYNNEELTFRCTQVKNMLENYEILDENLDSFHSKCFHSILINNISYCFPAVLKKYIDRIKLDENIFEPFKIKISQQFEQRFYHQLIVHLSECSNGVKYYLLHKGFHLFC
jgi:hypothetical protein